MFHKFFYFRRRERAAIIILLLIVTITIILLNIDFKSKRTDTTAQFEKTLQEYQNHLGEQKRKQENTIKPLLNFNPNNDTLDELIEKGVSQPIAKNIVNYRSKGGKYTIKSDLKRLYSINDSTYEQLEPHILLPHTKASFNINKGKQKQTKPLKPTYTKAFKYPEGTHISLNEVDTTELVKIPKIGVYTAQKIVKYRNRLGGFYSIEQFKDIDLTPEEFKDWFIIDTTFIHKININSATFKELLKHPYLSYEQVSGIFQVKRKQGNLKSFKQLKLLESFTTDDLNRLNIYFFCQ